MNWAQFKDPVSHICAAGTVVAFWSFTQELAGSRPFIVMTNFFVTEFRKTFRENCIVSVINAIRIFIL